MTLHFNTGLNPHPYPQTLFAVPMTCDDCVKAVSDALYRVGGITNVEARLDDQLVRVEGTGTCIRGFMRLIARLIGKHGAVIFGP